MGVRGDGRRVPDTTALRVGFVGAGNMNRTHVENVAALDGATVAAVCDIDAERARTVAEEYSASSYTDHETMLEEEALDAVYLAVPPFAHDGQELTVLEHGAALFVEKPLALDRAYARDVEQAVERRDAVTQVGYVLRYDRMTQRAREILDGRTISLVDAQYWCGVPDPDWWPSRESSGGQVVEQSTHLYDTIRHFAGEVERVSAAGDRRVVEEIDFEDTTSATMHHANGTVSHVSSTSASPDDRIQVNVVGDGVRLTIDYLADELTGTVDGESISVEGDANRFRDEDAAFLEAVRAGDPDAPRSPYADARRTFELTLAVEDALAAETEVQP